MYLISKWYLLKDITYDSCEQHNIENMSAHDNVLKPFRVDIDSFPNTLAYNLFCSLYPATHTVLAYNLFYS